MGDTTLVSWAGGERNAATYTANIVVYTIICSVIIHVLCLWNMRESWNEKIALLWLSVWIVVLVRQT